MKTQEQKDEGNKIIAKFMGLPYCLSDLETDNFGDQDVERWAIFNHYYTASEMRFHTSWDWLMPVCKKAAIGEAEISKEGIHLLESVYGAITSFDITQAFRAIVEFLEWCYKEAEAVALT